ncbi:MAG: hypothetical protein N2C12_11400 [Planctomycetales bacterium]
MNASKTVKLLLLVMLAGLFIGCSSPADQAAQNLVDLNKKISALVKSGDPADAAKATALLPEVTTAMTKLTAEMKKMTPEQQRVFLKKWRDKTGALGQ